MTATAIYLRFRPPRHRQLHLQNATFSLHFYSSCSSSNSDNNNQNQNQNQSSQSYFDDVKSSLKQTPSSPQQPRRTSFLSSNPNYTGKPASPEEIRRDLLELREFSKSKLNERLTKVKEVDDKEMENKKGVRFEFYRLRESLAKLQDVETKEKTPARRMLSELGTPNFMSAPPKGVLVEKSRMPNQCSKSAKKRKNNDVIDLIVSAFDYDNAAEQMSRCVQGKLEQIEDIQRLANTRIAAAERDVAELTKLRNENRDLKASVTKRFAEADAKIVQAKKVLLSEIKRDATIAVLEARILMASEAASKGFDTSIWTVSIWKAKLSELKGEDPDVVTTLEDTAGKAPKPASDKAPKTAVDKASKAAAGKEDVVMEEQEIL